MLLIQVDETVTLQCELSHPNIPVTWFKQLEKIYQSAKYQISVDDHVHKLTIEGLQKDDQCQFSCHTRPNPDVTTKCKGMYPPIILKIYLVLQQHSMYLVVL